MKEAKKDTEKKERERLRLRSKGKAVPIPPAKPSLKKVSSKVVTIARRLAPSKVTARVVAPSPPPPPRFVLPDFSNPGDIAAGLAARFALGLAQRDRSANSGAATRALPKRVRAARPSRGCSGRPRCRGRTRGAACSGALPCGAGSHPFPTRLAR